MTPHPSPFYYRCVTDAPGHGYCEANRRPLGGGGSWMGVGR